MKLAAVAGAILLALIGIVTWQSVLDTKMELRNLRDDVRDMKALVQARGGH